MNKTVFWVMVTGVSVSTCTKKTFFSGEPPIDETRATAPFTRIEVHGDLDVTILQGPRSHVTVEGEPAAVALVDTKVNDGTLSVRWRGQSDPDDPVSVEVGVESLEGIDLFGSGNATVEGIRAQKFEAILYGSGDMTLEGTAKKFKSAVYGSGEIDAEDLITESTQASVEGSGEAWVFAKRHLHARVHGSGEVLYSGAPRRVNKRVQGSGSVQANNDTDYESDDLIAEDEDADDDDDDDPDF